MSKKMINSERIEGLVYEHTLEIKKVGNETSPNYGKEFIAGELRIATDSNLLNVIPVHFSYVTEVTSTGKNNATYAVLKKIIDEKRTVLDVGPEEALKVRIDTALALNDFFTQDNRLVSTKMNEGGFVSIVNEISKEEKERNKFTCDMFITNVKRIEADEERHIDKDFVTVSGIIFNFRNEILPVDFKVENEAGMAWFESADISPKSPIFTKVWGTINCSTKVDKVTEETAFGEAAVRTFERKVRDWVITGCQPEPYDFGNEEVLTAADLEKAQQEREIKLADIKKRSEDYRNQKGGNVVATNISSTPAASVVPNKPFTF